MPLRLQAFDKRFGQIPKHKPNQFSIIKILLTIYARDSWENLKLDIFFSVSPCQVDNFSVDYITAYEFLVLNIRISNGALLFSLYICDENELNKVLDIPN